MSNFGKTAIFVSIIILIFGVFYYQNYQKTKINHIGMEQIQDVIKENEYTMIYFGKEDDHLTKMFKTFQREYLLKIYYSPSTIQETRDFFSQYQSGLEIDTNEVYAVYVEGEYQGIINTVDGNRFVELLRKYLYGEIPDSEKNYKVLSTADEYIKKVNSKNYTVAVFGATSCSFCSLYLPIVNDIAGEYELDIYYFDEDVYPIEEYDQILDLNFEIPAKCTTTGDNTTMLAGFPKPMTIITKSGEFVDCIRGYVEKDVVIDTFKQYKIIKE